MYSSELQKTQTYSQDQVQQILQLAIARKDSDGEWSREQLWEIALELGIDRSAIESAEKDWLSQNLLDQKRQAFDQARKEIFQQKLVKFLIVNSFLLILNYLGAGNLSWSLYILLIWGLFISLNAWNTFQLKGEAYEKALQNWHHKHDLKRSIETIWQNLQKAWQ
jgi:hypothetical protein